MRALGAAAFASRLQAVRGELSRRGLTDETLVPAFALVREAAARSLDVEPYDVQIAAGRVLADGMLAEMGTGEGKTLAAALPASAAALAGIPVHVVTANDYLAQRDADALRPLYSLLGLSVGTVTERMQDASQRRDAYACDITYTTSKAVAFDYLRDGLERRQRQRLSLAVEALASGRSLEDRLVLRGLCFAIVDEADSVLVDEARTPLVLSAQSRPESEGRIYRSAVRIARALREGREFERLADGSLALTPEGRDRVSALALPLGGLWSGVRHREEWVLRALAALHLYVRDRDYLVRGRNVEIIDPCSGRTAPDRSWELGLHQMIETKEGCELTPERETVARVTYQRFFRRYLRLGGMTGTAQEVAAELWSVYGLRVVPIPPRLPSQRRCFGARVLPTQAAKWEAVVECVEQRVREGRPVLVGTESVGASEHLGGLLAARGLAHRILNARQDAEEAAIVADAGQTGRITVSTNMAGRGTDIRLGAGVAERGGLHVIATHRARARRLDRQLFGRCGRQGEPGSSEAVTSLEDDLAVRWLPDPVRAFAARVLATRFPGAQLLARGLMSLCQRADEGVDGRVRRGLVASEERLDTVLAFSGRRE
jgi:preprotein translocase subunit SecA